MPELAEVEYYRSRWDAGIGSKVTEALVHPEARVFREEHPRKFRPLLTGSIFRSSETHGKNMLFRFSKGCWIGGHLGMSGSLRIEPPGYLPDRHDHLVLQQTRRTLVFSDPRMFGRIRFHSGEGPPDWWTALPPEILSRGFTKTLISEFIDRRGGSPIKALLLDQEVFPGVGNWMADEILWRVKIDPASRARTLTTSQALDLWRTTRRVTRQALEVIGTDWGTPPSTWLFNHRWKEGGDCPRCRNPLSRDTVAGRTSSWCPFCQS